MLLLWRTIDHLIHIAPWGLWEYAPPGNVLFNLGPLRVILVGLGQQKDVMTC